MKKTLYACQEVETEYDIYFEDLLELIEDCDDSEKNKILETIGFKFTKDDEIISASNLYDEEKVKLLKCAFKKYDIDELMSRLDIKRNEF